MARRYSFFGRPVSSPFRGFPLRADGPGARRGGGGRGGGKKGREERRIAGGAGGCNPGVAQGRNKRGASLSMFVDEIGCGEGGLAKREEGEGRGGRRKKGAGGRAKSDDVEAWGRCLLTLSLWLPIEDFNR